MPAARPVPAHHYLDSEPRERPAESVGLLEGREASSTGQHQPLDGQQNVLCSTVFIPPVALTLLLLLLLLLAMLLLCSAGGERLGMVVAAVYLRVQTTCSVCMHACTCSQATTAHFIS